MLLYFVYFTKPWAFPATLSDAVCSGNVVAVIRHLEMGADPNAKVPGSPDESFPLFQAFDNTGCQKPMEILIRQILIGYGGDIHQTTSSGYTLLMLAVGENNFENTRYLLANGLNPNARDSGGTSGLMIAEQSGNLDLVQLLSDFGAETTPRNGDDPAISKSSSM